jgi:hypothetical protein
MVEPRLTEKLTQNSREKKESIISNVVDPASKKTHSLSLICRAARLAISFFSREFCATIRRDLSKLQLAGKLQRIHGGATLNHNRMVEPRLTEKLTQNSREKKEIAKRAARQIRDNECVF